MTKNRYSEAALRRLIESLTNPIAVVQEGRIRLANEAYVEMLGVGREEVEGRSFFDFLYPEDRARLLARYQQREQGMLKENAPRRYMLPPRPGVGPRELAVHVQEVELEDSGWAMLCNHLILGERPGELQVAERLVETSAELVAARSEDAVRRLVVEGLARANLTAHFLAHEGERFSEPGGVLSEEDGALGRRALAEGWPLFGPDQKPFTSVYLPIGTPPAEVLRASGGELTPAYGPVLALFAKVVGAALADARMLADVERGRWEMSVVAETARFIALPEPPSLDEFLSRLASLLGAEAAVLHVPVSSERDEWRLVARVGLDAALEKAFAVLEGPLPSEAPPRSVEPLGEEEARVWREASGARLGQGASVHLSQGGLRQGLLRVLRGPERPLGPDDLRLLGTLAELLMMLMDQHRLRVESARQLSDSRLLLDMARTTAATLEVASILDVASDFLVRLLDVSDCFIFLYDEQTNVLRGATASTTQRNAFRGASVSVADSPTLAARVARERQFIVLSDVSKHEDVARSELALRFRPKSMLGLPLTSREELIGVVVVADARRQRVFPPSLLELAEATCGQIALAIANARLYESLWASYAELAAARAEMVKRERLAALGELSAIVAHEVRNPLGVIFNAVASLRRLLNPNGDAAMLLDILAEESDRLNRMVSDLLDYTRPREPIRQPEDVARLLQDSVESAWGQQGSPSQVTTTIDVAEDLPRVPLDRRLIRQALVNVLVNAIQSMSSQGGVIRVSARRESHDGRPYLRTDVVDQGCGIPNELLHRVFEPFFTTKAQGTGLGLAVVKRIIEEHHGEVFLASTLGRGTVFSIRLPLSQPTSPP
ncbi:ATP-binding protein [Melittangium boletus]|uniref:histidine kinase n=1 Tax=Melittangium boletus DSM 14713 TaxID=1294270 RepID=A0A250IJD4_9BACT|nr:ATP-binding protein [Melittangium boletus]ATB31056.1 sensor histidine kinase [Melittangium boletus DSM 14713]